MSYYFGSISFLRWFGFTILFLYHCGPQKNSASFQGSVYPQKEVETSIEKVTKNDAPITDDGEVQNESSDVVEKQKPIDTPENKLSPPKEDPPPPILPEEPVTICPTALQSPEKVSDLLGINLDMHKPDGSPDPSMLTNLGIKWLRIEFKPFQKDYDKAIAGYLGEDPTITITPLKKYKDAGLKIILIVDYMLYEKSYWPDMNKETWDLYFTNYKKNLTKITDKLDPFVDVWQIWNEPDHRVPGYEPYIAPSRYALLLSEFYNIIRPKSCAPIILGGLANGDGGTYIKKTIEEYQKLEGDFPFDAISIHPYGRGEDGLFENFGKLGDLINAYQTNAIDSNSLEGSVKIVITEVGLNASQDRNYKEYVIAMYKKSFELGLPFLTWFAWHDNMVDSWGMFRKDGSHRPSYEAFLELKEL